MLILQCLSMIDSAMSGSDPQERSERVREKERGRQRRERERKKNRDRESERSFIIHAAWLRYVNECDKRTGLYNSCVTLSGLPFMNHRTLYTPVRPPRDSGTSIRGIKIHTEHYLTAINTHFAY